MGASTSNTSYTSRPKYSRRVTHPRQAAADSEALGKAEPSTLTTGYRIRQEKLNRIGTLRAQGCTNDVFLPLIDAEQKGSEFPGGIDEAAYLSLILLIGAADISAVSTWSFTQAMLMFPRTQDKARQAIIDVVGDRIPIFEDIDQIPYVRDLLKETWRWRSPVALGQPHITTKELVYNGMHIPNGAQIHLNAWAVQHDPMRYHGPERFIHERFDGDLTTTMQSINAKDVSERDHFAFGAGSEFAQVTRR
ncbi:hypothetical protein LTR70_000225 [Exophiala xenobiotica]|uniref:Cytochrome P450 n=1 Tax=Lithohypha guttulata TaxID=1690604 RepID=A0ABR0K4C2_9EURO|nr:hypothetical protein LTR24_007068 [Lithohypha guttulata]KAK5330903.1 hypothetical protein LTR70_000225 [Exophiala xenobiotica]